MRRSGPAASRVAEGAATALAGAALGGLAWSIVDLSIAGVVVGTLNGAISGARGTYRWRSVSGPLAFVLDSTWAAPMTLAGLAAHLVAVFQGKRSGYVKDLSVRRNRHVYVRGLQTRKGFAITLGNVINGAEERARDSDRRRQLITDHEDVHVWQARWFGPLYPVLYVGWMIGGGALGAVVWLARRRDQPVTKVVESYAYYCNPFEWWAYSRDGHWPPSKKVEGVGWTMPAVSAFSATSRRFGRGRPRVGSR